MLFFLNIVKKTPLLLITLTKPITNVMLKTLKMRCEQTFLPK